jgi:unsaturated rhamnogalacturonyl hydrolase
MDGANKELIDRIVRRTVEGRDREWSMDIHRFDWVPGVGLYGICKAYETTKEAYILEFLKDWAERHIEEAYDLQTVNSTAPLTAVLKIYKETGISRYLQVSTDIADKLIETAPRTPEGGLEHTVTEDVPDFKEQIWADTLFMAGIFFAQLYDITKEKKYGDETVLQLYVHHKRLKDEKTGAYYHGYHYGGRGWMSGALWARANAWVVISTFEIIDLIRGDFPEKEYILGAVREQAEALGRFQRENGMFGTLLDHEDSYDEASATAGIAYGLARGISMGYLSGEYEHAVSMAVDAVKRCVNEAGEVEQVSRGTPVLPSKEDYKTISRNPTLYGQGLALLAICS